MTPLERHVGTLFGALFEEPRQPVSVLPSPLVRRKLCQICVRSPIWRYGQSRNPLSELPLTRGFTL